MNIASREALYIILAFIVPGFITALFKSKLTTGRLRTGPDAFLYYITYSAINYSLSAWVIYYILFTDVLSNHPIYRSMIWISILFILPMITGILLGISERHQWLEKILRCIGVNLIHGTPTAWDYSFEKIKVPHWMIVTLKDGSKVYGYFGGLSLASSSDSERDIFIEQMYNLDEEERWISLNEGRGVLIIRDQISCVEFWPA